MADKSQKSQEKRKSAFIISPIDDENTDIRFRFEGLFALVYKPVLDDLGYDCEPIVNELQSGSIFSQIMDHLINDDLVICDLTYNNPNVMYELAIRHIIRKPVIMIIEKLNENFKIPFDIREDRIFSFPSNPAGYAKLKQTLPGLIQKAMDHKVKINNPIIRHINLNNIRLSLEASESDPLKILFNEVSEIKEKLQNSNTISNNIASALSIARAKEIEDNPFYFEYEYEIVYEADRSDRKEIQDSLSKLGVNILSTSLTKENLIRIKFSAPHWSQATVLTKIPVILTRIFGNKIRLKYLSPIN